MKMSNIFVTGIGLVTPFGRSISEFWSRILGPTSATKKLQDPIFASLPCRVAATVEPFRSAYDDQPAFIKYAMCAADDAIADADLLQRSIDKTRIAVSIGTGLSGIGEIAMAQETLKERGHRRISPHFIPRISGNMAAGQLAIKYGFMGPNNSLSTACATGLHSLGDAMQLLNSGMADVVIAGATEAAICPLTLAGFSQARALNVTSNEDPARASRPFDKARAGFVLGEGAAVFVLERHASVPDKYYCRLTGFGASADAHHITSSRPDGLGAMLAMGNAMKGIDGPVDYINAHATSTPVGDEAEAMAIRRLFKDRSPCISSSKGHLGHLLGAAGAVEAAICALALRHQTIPHTANLTDPICGDFDFVVLAPRQRTIRNVLCNSFGFGGTNASLLLSV